MIDLFTAIPVCAEGVTGSYVQAQVQIHARDMFTGLLHVSGGNQFVLILLKGKPIALYRLAGRSWENILSEEWEVVLTGASGSLRELALTDDALRVYRLLLEADFSESRTVPSLPANQLPSYMSQWKRDGRAGLALLRQGDISAVMLMPAGSLEATDGVLVSASQLQTGPVVMTQIRGWGERSCQVTLCTDQIRSEGWREYNLRVSFSRLIQRLLKRYEQLAGRFLVSDLDERVNLQSSRSGWAISLYGNNLSVRQYFETAARAGNAYAALLGVMDQQMSSVVGEKMTDNILSEASAQLDSEAHALLEEYVLSRISLGHAAGMAGVSR